MNFKKFVTAFLSFTIAVCFGWHKFNRHHSAMVPSNIPRQPAAIAKVFDFSHLEGTALDQASRQRLLAGAKSMMKDGDIGIQLGHFVTRGSDGQATFACDIYDRITLSFEAEGQASNGQRPVFEVEGPCTMSQDVNEIEPIWIPIAKVISQKPADMELYFREPSTVALKFKNMPDEWPQQWVLSHVRVFNQAQGKGINIESQDIYQLSAKPLTLIWPASQKQ